VDAIRPNFERWGIELTTKFNRRGYILWGSWSWVDGKRRKRREIFGFDTLVSIGPHVPAMHLWLRIVNICRTTHPRRGGQDDRSSFPNIPRLRRGCKLYGLTDCGVPTIRAVRVHFTVSQRVIAFHPLFPMAWSSPSLTPFFRIHNN
jgi:hypothetical protein